MDMDGIDSIKKKTLSSRELGAVSIMENVKNRKTKMEIEYEPDGTIRRRFSKEWAYGAKSVLHMDLIPKIVDQLVQEKKNMVEYIESLHNELDKFKGQKVERLKDTIEQNNIRLTKPNDEKDN